MAIPSFFKQNKPRGFNYVPRYFDPVREEREERLRTIGREQEAQGMEHEAQSWGQARSRATQSREAGEQEVQSMELEARSQGQGARGTEQEAQSREHGAWGKQQEARGMEHGAWSKEQSPSADTTTAGNTPYRSKILRGDMKNYFPRNKERVERHSMIRLLVIIMIMVLAIYIYFRFF